jgi:DNA-binding NarL/FixJ family response regulator
MFWPDAAAKDWGMKFLVIDDHALIRDALASVLGQLQPGSAVIEASTCAEALEAVAVHADLSLVLLDLTLPDGNGFALLEKLRRDRPAVSVVVLSAIQDRASVMRALEASASGFIPKSAQREVMLSALRLVFAGGIYVPPEILAPDRKLGAEGAAPPRDIGLSERQEEVLALLMQGLSNKAIGHQLDLAEPTVKNHVTAILKALRARNRTAAVAAANRRGWALPDKDKR